MFWLYRNTKKQSTKAEAVGTTQYSVSCHVISHARCVTSKDMDGFVFTFFIIIVSSPFFTVYIHDVRNSFQKQQQCNMCSKQRLGEGGFYTKERE